MRRNSSVAQSTDRLSLSVFSTIPPRTYIFVLGLTTQMQGCHVVTEFTYLEASFRVLRDQSTDSVRFGLHLGRSSIVFASMVQCC